MKTLLILVDGMLPDSLKNIDLVEDLKAKSSYTLNAQTVLPSDTLPCHTSLFYSVDPSVHNITTNTYYQGVNPIDGLCEVLDKNGKKCAFFFNWGELRDLAKPDSLIHSCFYNGNKFGFSDANEYVTNSAIDYLKNNDVDFTFLYLGNVDAVGHSKGWMSDEYLDAVKNSWKNIERVFNSLPLNDYTVIITADHGGHDHTHGTTLKEDMTIPMFLLGKDFLGSDKLSNISIKDIAPTVCKILGVTPNEKWTGKSIL